MDLLDETESSTDVLPDKSRVRRAYTYVVAVVGPVPETCVLHEFDDTNGGKTAALRYVNERGHEQILKVYKVVQVIPVESKD